ncbi:MAG: hypothetical protein ACOX4U_00400 [Anaerovoracaceae bacterium]|jgi:hypothetical protein
MILGLLQLKIQSGSTNTGAANATINVEIEAVNTGKCIVLWNSITSGSGTAYLTSGTNLQLKHSVANAIVDWQVIEFGGAV